jgi:hypothetical protein
MSTSTKIWLLLVVSLAAAPATVFADGIAGQTSFVGGLDIPLHPGEFEEMWNLGMHGILEFGIVFGDRVSLVAGAGYSRHTLDGERLLREAELDIYGVTLKGGAYSALTITGGVNTYVVPLSHVVSPYFIARFGYMRLNIDDATIIVPGYDTFYIPGNTEDAFGIQGGFGTSFNAGRYISLLVETRYSLGLASDETGSLGLFGGMTMRW